MFGLTDPEQIKGRKCYEVLQGRQEPCDFCNNHLLSPDNYLEWEIDNDLADGHFLLKDRLVDWNGDGRLSRMEIALDVTRSDREKKRLQETLGQLSFADGLTGTMNRNAFIRDITPPLKDKGYGRGIVFIDVNGLKETNDKYGHVAGDELLMRTCEKMVSVFGDEDKYRTGGDEFVIICRGMEKQEFQEKAELLREKFRKAGNLAAIGASWAEEGRTLQEAVNEAENLMYQEKKSFYSSTHRQEMPGRAANTAEPGAEAEPGGVTDILEEARVKQLANEMLRLYFEKQDVKGMLRHMDG